MKTKGQYAGQDIQMIGTQLRKRRIQLGLTQQQLADKLGVTKGGLSAYEMDKVSPSVEKLIKLTNILGVSIEYLYGNEDIPSNTEEALTDIDRSSKVYKKLATIADRQMGIGSQIIKLRTEHGISPEELALKLDITEDMLTKFEKDLKYPTYEILVKMAQVFNVSTEELLGIDTGKTLYIGSLSDENRKLIKDLVRSMK